ncbi:MAG: class I SAM-dependent methyltransferase [Chloroflexota bacterium]
MNFFKKIFSHQPVANEVNKDVPFSEKTFFRSVEVKEWYNPIILGPSTVSAQATDPACLRQVAEIIRKLEDDDYIHYLLEYYLAGLERFGKYWRYADISTVLLSVAQLIQPKNYLEIGVRRGRSLAMVAVTCPHCEIVGFDLWIADYAGMPNPGPDFVRMEMEKLGYLGKLTLISGDSHQTLSRYFAKNPNSYFDLITVDGDHSEQGAEQDLLDVIPRLNIGGAIVFDDISHPNHPYLAEVWKKVVSSNPRFTTWEYTELGYGVAVGIRQAT